MVKPTKVQRALATVQADEKLDDKARRHSSPATERAYKNFDKVYNSKPAGSDDQGRKKGVPGYSAGASSYLGSGTGGVMHKGGAAHHAHMKKHLP